MRVTMKLSISGSRNGQDWPGAGGSIDLPKAEAQDLIDARIAVAYEDAAPPRPPKAEKPTTPKKPATPKPEKATASAPEKATAPTSEKADTGPTETR